MQIDKNEIVIRAATENDLEHLYVFEQGVISAERPFDPTLSPDPLRYYDLPLLISSPDSELLVAEYQGRPIASGYARIENSEAFLAHRQHAWLGFMYVLPEYRRQGVNEMIMAGLQAWALSKKIFELRLEVYYDNHFAISAYEKIGFSKHMIEMRMKLNN